MIALLLAVAQIAVPVATLARSIPATTWSCTLADSGEHGFQLSGKFDEIPAGTNGYDRQPTSINGDGPERLRGKAQFKSGPSDNLFRYYEVWMDGEGVTVNKLNFVLRNGGHGRVEVVRLDPPRPYDFIATGLCKSDFTLPGKAD